LVVEEYVRTRFSSRRSIATPFDAIVRLFSLRIFMRISFSKSRIRSIFVSTVFQIIDYGIDDRIDDGTIENNEK